MIAQTKRAAERDPFPRPDKRARPLALVALALAASASLVGMQVQASRRADEAHAASLARAGRQGHEGAPTEDSAGRQVLGLPSSPRYTQARQRALAALRAALPSWSDDINRVPADVRKHEDPTQLDPLAMASMFTSEPLAFSELRSNGRTVYKNRSQDTTVKYDQKRGYWKFISPLKAGSQRATVTDAESEDRAHALAKELHLPDEELGVSRAAGIASTDGNQTEVIGRHVRIERQVNGIPVDESGLQVTYNPDGSVARVERRWPHFELDGGDVVSREQAANDLATALADEFEKAPDLEVGSSMRYTYDEQSGTHQPTLRVHVGNSGQDRVAHTVEYSLTTGTVHSGGEDSDDEP